MRKSTCTPSSVAPLLMVWALASISESAWAQPAPATTLPLSASAPTTAPLTVDEAVRLALERNPRITAAALDVASARAGVRSARALTNPNLTFTPALNPGGSDEELLLQQPLELNGTRSARTGVAQAQLRQTRAQAVVEVRDLVFQTKQAYFELARAQDLRGVAEDALQIAEEFDRVTRRLAEEGLRPGIDRVQTQVEVTRARQQLTRAQSQEQMALAALNTLMGRAPAEGVGVLPPLPAPDLMIDVEALVQQALAARTEIEANQALREQFRQEARLARAQGRPDLVPQFRAENVTRGVDGVGIGIGITLPFLDYGGRRHRIGQAEDAARAQEARIEAARNQIRREVEQSVVRVRAAAAVVQDYQGGVLDEARRVLEARQTGFQAGLTSVVELLEAQRTYRNVLAEYANALADYAEARAELERATGAVSANLLPDNGAGQGHTK